MRHETATFSRSSLVDQCQPNLLEPRFQRSVHTGNVALGSAATHAVLIESTRRLARAIETGNYPAVHVDHLASSINPEAGAGIVNHGRRPRGVERRCLNLVLR